MALATATETMVGEVKVAGAKVVESMAVVGRAGEERAVAVMAAVILVVAVTAVGAMEAVVMVEVETVAEVSTLPAVLEAAGVEEPLEEAQAEVEVAERMAGSVATMAVIQEVVMAVASEASAVEVNTRQRAHIFVPMRQRCLYPDRTSAPLYI